MSFKLISVSDETKKLLDSKASSWDGIKVDGVLIPTTQEAITAWAAAVDDFGRRLWSSATGVSLIEGTSILDERSIHQALKILDPQEKIQNFLPSIEPSWDS